MTFSDSELIGGSDQWSYFLMVVLNPFGGSLATLGNITAFLEMVSVFIADYIVYCRLRWCGAGNMDWKGDRGLVRHYGHIILRAASREYTI